MKSYPNWASLLSRWQLLLLCRFSDAGMRRLSTRCGGRRPKSGGTVKPFLPCFCAFFCSTAPQAFFRPDRRFRTPARAEAVKVGRRSAIEAHFDVSRPRLDSFEHGGRLDDCRAGRTLGCRVSLPLLGLLRGLSFAGPASMSMSRAMIASAYIRQLRSGLPLCCMHGQSRR